MHRSWWLAGAMRGEKVAVIVVCTSLAVGVLASHRTGSLWPFFHGSVLVAGLTILAATTTRAVESSFGLLVLLTVLVAVVYRGYVFLYPASLFAADPDALARTVYNIVQTGDLALTSDFYTRAPAFFLLGASAADITALRPTRAFVIYPILFGTTFTLGTIAGVQQLVDATARSVLAAGVIAGLVAASVQFSLITVPQSLAIVLWMVLFIAVLRYFDWDKTVHGNVFLVIILVLLPLSWSHKFALVPFTLTVVGLLVLSLFRSNVQRIHVSILAVFGVATLGVQWTIQTQFGTSVASIFYQVFAAGALGTGGEPIELSGPIVAHHPYGFPIGFLIRNLHGIVLMFVSGVLWILIAYTRRGMKYTVLLVASAASAIYTLVAAAVTIVPSSRMFAHAAPVLVVLVGVGVSLLWNRPSKTSARGVLMAVVAVFLVTQIVSSAAAPDLTGTPRDYLNEEEAAAKIHGHEVVPETVRTDPFYANEIVKIERQEGSRTGAFDKYQSVSYGFLTRNILTREYQYVMFRTGVSTFWLNGWWVLDWSPERELSERYHVVYANDGVLLFKRPPD